MRCFHCKQPLTWTRNGWVHPNGKAYVQRKRTLKELERLRRIGLNPNPDELIDDHVALPDFSEDEKKGGGR